MSDDARLTRWAENVWLAEAPLRFYGVPFGARMTVVRLASGALLLHSPIPLDAPLREEIAALGPVRDIVAPNKLHHLHLGAASEAFPEARVWAPPGLARKREDLRFDAELVSGTPWEDELESATLRGSRVMEEVVFFHAPSRTLVVADMCEHFGPWSPALTRVVARLGRMYARPRMPADWQLSFRDRDATRASFERVFAWDFDRTILAHGRLVERDAKEVLAGEYAWALRR